MPIAFNLLLCLLLEFCGSTQIWSKGKHSGTLSFSHHAWSISRLLVEFTPLCRCTSSAVMGTSESRGWWETAAYRSFRTALTLVPSDWKHDCEVGVSPGVTRGHLGSPRISVRRILVRNDLALRESSLLLPSARRMVWINAFSADYASLQPDTNLVINPYIIL